MLGRVKIFTGFFIQENQLFGFKKSLTHSYPGNYDRDFSGVGMSDMECQIGGSKNWFFFFFGENKVLGTDHFEGLRTEI